MALRQSLIRLVTGLVVVALVLVAAFSAIVPAMHRWGATDAEVARAMPGDDVLPTYDIEWMHATTINAPPEQVWPWIAQIGDDRGGFYSYTFIENRVGAITGDPSYNVVYRNANQVVPEWQQPQPGDDLIRGFLHVKALEQGRWMVAESSNPAFGWSWVWLLEPQRNGEQSRLLVRMRVGTTGEAAMPPLAGFLMDVGGFVMEQRMVQGITLRAEGGSEPAYSEALEIALWFSTLAIGLVAGWLFVRRQQWQWPLAVGIAAVLALVLITIVQPPLWARFGIDALLVAGLWRAGQRKQEPAPKMSTSLRGAAS